MRLDSETLTKSNVFVSLNVTANVNDTDYNKIEKNFAL